MARREELFIPRRDLNPDGSPKVHTATNNPKKPRPSRFGVISHREKRHKHSGFGDDGFNTREVLLKERARQQAFLEAVNDALLGSREDQLDDHQEITQAERKIQIIELKRLLDTMYHRLDQQQDIFWRNETSDKIKDTEQELEQLSYLADGEDSWLEWKHGDRFDGVNMSTKNDPDATNSFEYQPERGEDLSSLLASERLFQQAKPTAAKTRKRTVQHITGNTDIPHPEKTPKSTYK